MNTQLKRVQIMLQLSGYFMGNFSFVLVHMDYFPGAEAPVCVLDSFI